MKKFLVAILVVLVAGVGLAVYAGWDLIGIHRATSLSTVPVMPAFGSAWLVASLLGTGVWARRRMQR